MTSETETNEQFYIRRVNETFNELQLLKEGSPDAYTDRVLTIGDKRPSIFISEPRGAIISYYSIHLLELFIEGVNRGFSVPKRLLSYIAEKFSTYIEDEGKTDLGTLLNVSKENFRDKVKRGEHGFDIIKIIALSVCYRGFRCGFAYRSLGISIKEGMLKTGPSDIMTGKYIIKQVKSHYHILNLGQKTLLKSFISGYINNAVIGDSPVQSTLKAPYEPKSKHLLKLANRLAYYLRHNKKPMTTEADKEITEKDLTRLNILHYPKNSSSQDEISRKLTKDIHSKSSNKSTNEIKGEVIKTLNLVDIITLGNSPRIIKISNNYDIPLLLVTDKKWDENTNKLFIDIMELGLTPDIIKEIEDLNKSLED